MTDPTEPEREPEPLPAWGSLRKPDEPPAPTVDEWLTRMRARSLNVDGAPTWHDWQTERVAPEDGPFVRRGK